MFGDWAAGEDAIQDRDEAAARAELTGDAVLADPAAARQSHCDIPVEAVLALLG